MNAPLAVSPENVAPGLHIGISLVSGAQAAGIQGLRCCILTSKETGQGDLLVNTRRPVFSEDDVRVAIGRGLGYFAYRSLLANDKQAVCDIVACEASAGAVATQTLTFTGTTTARCVWEVDVSGFTTEIEWAVGDDDDDAAEDAAGRLNAALGDKVYCTFAFLANVVTASARAPGPAGNDVRISIRQKQGAGGTCTLGGETLAGGTTELDYTAALAAINTREYDYIYICTSNTDATSASSSSNPARAEIHIDALSDGLNAKLQQLLFGSTTTRAAAIVHTEARNNPIVEHVNFQLSRDLPCEVGAAELGNRMARRRLNSNANRVNQPLRYLRGAADKETNTPNEGQINAASRDAGLALIGYNASGQPMLIRAVTTYHKDGSGNRDSRCFDVNEVDGIYDYVKDLRVGIPQEFQTPDHQVLLMRDRVEGDEPLPENTVEERDVKAFITGRTRAFWIPKGVIQGPAFNEAVENGALIVSVNDTDETQCDIFIPAKVVKIAAKFGLFVAKEN